VIALDTNVLVRFLVQDDPEQARVAGEIIGGLSRERVGFVSREVVLELVWVLERAYGFGRAEVAAALDGILAAVELSVEAADDVGLALERYRTDGFGIADSLIASASARAGAEDLVTFDRKAARLPGVHLLTP
jgi:predicted nucleic-acid-binding protein